MTTLPAPASPLASTPASAPARAALPGWVRHLRRGLVVLVAGTVLAMPAVWWTATQEGARAAAELDAVIAEDFARTAERVEAGELPASVLDGTWWEPVPVEPVPLGSVLAEALPLGTAALTGFLLAGRPRHGRATAVFAATVLLGCATLLRLAAASVPIGLVHSVPPLGWDLDLVLAWHESPYTPVPVAVMAVLVVGGALAARPAERVPRPRGTDVAVGVAVGLVVGVTATLDLTAGAASWTWGPGLALPVVVLAAVAWLGSDAPATPVLAALAMLAASVPYLRAGLDGMTLVHTGIAFAAVVAVTLAALRAPASRALARLVA